MKFPLQKFTISLNLLLIFAFSSLAFVIGGYFYYQDLKVRIIYEKQDELSAIAELKVNKINSWLKDHIEYANSIKNNPLITADLKEFFEDPSSKSNRGRLLAWMKSRLNILSLQNICLLDSNGYFRLSLDPRQQSSPLHAKHQIEEAMASKSVVFSDFYKDENGKIHLGLIVPLLDNRVIYGVLVLKIDPYQSLFPLIQSWPTSSRTAETLLVRREGDEVVFLNELRHKKDAALNLKFSVNEKQVPAVMAGRGVQGIVEGTDYRSKKVLADVRHIPDTPWFLVTKIDSDEILALLKETALSVTLLVSLLIIAAAAFTGLLWRHQRAVFYRKQYEAAEKIARLTRLYAVLSQINQTIVRVRERDALFQTVCRIFVEFGKFRLAWIGLIDPETKLVNSVAMHGSGEEYLRNIRIAIDDSPTGRYPAGTAIKEGKYCVVNDIKNDPMMLPWREEALKRGYRSLAAAPIRLNREVIGVFAIYASEVDFFDKDEKKFIEEIGVDISFALESFETEAKRKQAEEVLRAGEHFLASIFTSIQDGISILDNDLTIIRVNAAMERWFAHALPLAGKKCYDVYHGRSEPCEVCHASRTFKTGQPDHTVFPITGPGGEVMLWLEIFIFPLFDKASEKITGVIEYVRDITERKRDEEKLCESEERYRQ
ncbi:MAG: GAF domain-containing protein, partial [Pseudomonadota bacterium]